MFPESVPVGTPHQFALMRPPREVTIQNFRFLYRAVSPWRLAKVGAVKRLKLKMIENSKFQLDFLYFLFQKSNYDPGLLKIIHKHLLDTKICQAEMFLESVPIGTPDPSVSMLPTRGVAIQNFRFLGLTVSSGRLTKIAPVKKLILLQFIN